MNNYLPAYPRMCYWQTDCFCSLVSLYLFENVGCNRVWNSFLAFGKLFLFVCSLPVSAARDPGSSGERVTSGSKVDQWEVKRIKLTGHSPQGPEVKRQGLSERAAGWSGPLGIAEDCMCVRLCVCVFVGRGKGGKLFRFRTLSWLGMLWHCGERQKEKRDGKVNILNLWIINNFKNNRFKIWTLITNSKGFQRISDTRMTHGSYFYSTSQHEWALCIIKPSCSH